MRKFTRSKTGRGKGSDGMEDNPRLVLLIVEGEAVFVHPVDEALRLGVPWLRRLSRRVVQVEVPDTDYAQAPREPRCNVRCKEALQENCARFLSCPLRPKRQKPVHRRVGSDSTRGR